MINWDLNWRRKVYVEDFRTLTRSHLTRYQSLSLLYWWTKKDISGLKHPQIFYCCTCTQTIHCQYASTKISSSSPEIRSPGCRFFDSHPSREFGPEIFCGKAIYPEVVYPERSSPEATYHACSYFSFSVANGQYPGVFCSAFYICRCFVPNGH